MRYRIMRIACVILSAVVFLFSAVSAEAVDTKLYGGKISAKNGRYFDVPVYMQSSFALSAATFTLKYDTKELSYSRAYTDIPSAKVKSRYTDGSVKVIFLCPEGLRINKKSRFLNVRFKAVSAGSCSIKITSEDCVDPKAKNFTAPKSVNCTVYTGGKSVGGRGKTAAGRYNSSGKSSGKKSFNLKLEDYTEPKYDIKNGEDNGLIYDFKSASADKDNPLITVAIIVSAVIAVTVFAAIKLKSGKKSDKKKDKKREEE